MPLEPWPDQQGGPAASVHRYASLLKCHESMEQCHDRLLLELKGRRSVNKLPYKHQQASLGVASCCWVL